MVRTIGVPTLVQTSKEIQPLGAGSLFGSRLRVLHSVISTWNVILQIAQLQWLSLQASRGNKYEYFHHNVLGLKNQLVASHGIQWSSKLARVIYST